MQQRVEFNPDLPQQFSKEERLIEDSARQLECHWDLLTVSTAERLRRGSQGWFLLLHLQARSQWQAQGCGNSGTMKLHHIEQHLSRGDIRPCLDLSAGIRGVLAWRSPPSLGTILARPPLSVLHVPALTVGRETVQNILAEVRAEAPWGWRQKLLPPLRRYERKCSQAKPGEV